MLIAQITDTHVVEPGVAFADRIDSAGRLRTAIAHLAAHRPRPDALLLTGDLVNDARAEQYDVLVEVLREIPDDVPVHVVPGNHDDRTQLRARFAGLPEGGPDDPLHQAIDAHVARHGVRLVLVDTTVPRHNGGHFGDADAAWLDAALAEAPDTPTLIAQHHPPFETGIAWMDDVGMAGSDLEADVVARHPQVLGVTCGHLHRTIAAPFAGTIATCWPSTAAQVLADLVGDRPFTYVDETPAVALHLVIGGTLRSHLTVVGEPATWRPSWADHHE